MWWPDPKTAPQSHLEPWVLALLRSALGAIHTPKLWETRARPKGKGEGSGTQHSKWELIQDLTGAGKASGVGQTFPLSGSWTTLFKIPSHMCQKTLAKLRAVLRGSALFLLLEKTVVVGKFRFLN